MPTPFRVISYNIRYDSPPHERHAHEEPWSVRCRLILGQLRFLTLGHENTIICLQEARKNQLVDILNGMNDPKLDPGATDDSTSTSKRVYLRNYHGASFHPNDELGRVEYDGEILENRGAEWTFIGVGRDDGCEAGEFNPIIFRSDKWKCLSWRTTWLSETPNKPSKSWGAYFNRMLNHAEFRFLDSKQRPLEKQIVILNTHLDHESKNARIESMKLINHCCSKLYPTQPIILSGDFNTKLDEEFSNVHTSDSQAMVDTFEWENRYFGEHYTFTGFDSKTPNTSIDKIFYAIGGEVDKEKIQKGPLKLKSFAIIPNEFEGFDRASDHRALVGDFEL